MSLFLGSIGGNMSNVLIVVDMQNDFLTGVFGSEYTANVIDSMSKYAHEFDGDIFFTKDVYDINTYLFSLKGQAFPFHCEAGTEGQQICSELSDLATDKNTIERSEVSPTNLIEIARNHTNVYIAGVCTDIDVVSIALLLRFYFPNKKIHVVERLCRGLNEATHDAAIAVLYSNLIEVV